MTLGIALILASTVAYNGSVMLLAAVARWQPGDSNLVLAVSRRASGLSAILLNLLGWGLEVGALVFIPLTLARILSVAGVGVLLGLARWALKEPLGTKELGGSGLVVLGVATAGTSVIESATECASRSVRSATAQRQRVQNHPGKTPTKPPRRAPWLSQRASMDTSPAPAPLSSALLPVRRPGLRMLVQRSSAILGSLYESKIRNPE